MFFQNFVQYLSKHEPSNVSTNDSKYQTETPSRRPSLVIIIPDQRTLIHAHDKETGRDYQHNCGCGVIYFVHFLQMLVIHHSKEWEDGKNYGNDGADHDTPPEGFFLRDIRSPVIRTKDYGDYTQNNGKKFDLSNPLGKQFCVDSSHFDFLLKCSDFLPNIL